MHCQRIQGQIIQVLLALLRYPRVIFLGTVERQRDASACVSRHQPTSPPAPACCDPRARARGPADRAPGRVIHRMLSLLRPHGSVRLIGDARVGPQFSQVHLKVVGGKFKLLSVACPRESLKGYQRGTSGLTLSRTTIHAGQPAYV